MGFLGDSLWVGDRSLARATVYTPDLALARTEPIRPSTDGVMLSYGGEEIVFRSALFQDLLPDGAVHASLRRPWIPEGSEFDSTLVRSAIVDADRTVRTIVAEYSDGPSRYVINQNGRLSGGLFPFTILPLYAMESTGNRFGLLVVGVEGEETGTIAVSMWDSDGNTIYARRHAVETVPLPRAIADSVIERQATSLDRFTGTGDAYRALSWTPPFYPPVEDFVVGRDGSAWVGLRSTSDSMSVYRVFDQQGDPYGEVRFSDEVDVEVADLTTAWGLVADELGVESVVRYEVRRDP